MKSIFNKKLIPKIIGTSIILLISTAVLLRPFNYLLNKQAIKSKQYNLKINHLIVERANKFAHADIRSVYDTLHLNKINNKQNNFYKVDCCGFVKLVLQKENLLNAVKEILNFIPKDFKPSIINETPSPLHYSVFLKNKKPKQHWYIINNAFDLLPGDFIIYTKKNQYKTYNSEYGQHIMIVAEKPRFYRKLDNKKLLWVDILDSTKVPHGASDCREIYKTTGIGKGTIGLVINNQNKPVQLIWQDHSNNDSWQPTIKDLLKRDVIMARIIR